MNINTNADRLSIVAYKEYLEPLKRIRKKQSKGMLLFFVICVLIGAGIGAGAASFGIRAEIYLDSIKPFYLPEALDFLYFIFFLGYYLITMVLHTVIHEAGHLVFGLLSGYRFLSFRVFSFTIVKNDGKLAIKKLKVLGTMGQCLMEPPQWRDDRPYPYVIYNLGGGLLNILSSILMIPLLFAGSTLWAWIAGLFIFTGILFAITNLVPMTLGVPNDGKNCLDCFKSRDTQRAFYLQLKINAELSNGAELTGFPVEIFQVQTPEGKKISALNAALYLLEYYWYLANGRKAEAETALASMEQKKGKLITAYINSIDLERLYFLVSQKAPIEQIAAYYTVLRPAFLQNTDLSVMRVKYAYYLLLNEEEREAVERLALSKKGKLPKKLPKQKKPVTAEKIYEDAVQIAKKHPVAGEARMHMRLVQEIKEAYSNECL